MMFLKYLSYAPVNPKASASAILINTYWSIKVGQWRDMTEGNW